MSVAGRLLRHAVDPLALACMAFLAAFSVGYSLFIGAMTSGGTPEAAARFMLLNLLFGVLSAIWTAVIILSLSRRLAGTRDMLPRSRLGPLLGVSAGLFVVGWLVQTIWPIILFNAFEVPDGWTVIAFRFPSVPLQLITFPFLVWQVALARGASEPSFGGIWSQVWRRWAILLAVLILVAASLVIERLVQPLAAGDAVPRTISLTLAVGPSAIMLVLEYLLAIIVYEDIDVGAAEVFG